MNEDKKISAYTVPTQGTREVFVEHYGVVRDLDNHSKYPGTSILRQSTPDAEEKAGRFILKEVDQFLCGNAGEFDYCGLTGRTMLCEFNGKRWAKVEDLTPATVDITSLFEMS